ncbi:MAG: MFS transporter [Cloacibacterium sp.]|nr:MFS transporter [Cloacibacterium sp.]
MQLSKDKSIAFSVFLSGFSCFALLYYYQSLLPEISSFFKVSKTESSLVVSSATTGMALGFLTCMFVADRFLRKKLIAFSLIIPAALSISSSLSESFIILVFINFLKGFLLSGSASISLAYISEEVSEKNSLKVTGLYIAGNAIGGMFGRVFAAYFAHEYSWQLSSQILSLLCLAFGVLFLIFSPNSTHFEPKKENIISLIRPNLRLIFNKHLIPYYITGFIILGVFVSIYNYLQFILVKPPFNFDKAYMPYIYLMYIFGVFGSVATAKLGKYTNSQNLLKLMGIIAAAGIALLYFNLTWVLILGLALFTFAFFIMHVLCNKSLGELYPEKRSVIISIYLLVYYLGSSVIGTSTGLILEIWGWQYFLLSLIVLTLSISLIFRKKT